MNCILLGAFVDWCIDCEYMHCVSNIKGCQHFVRKETNIFLTSVMYTDLIKELQTNCKTPLTHYSNAKAMCSQYQ
jgi:hypothetical protein